MAVTDLHWCAERDDTEREEKMDKEEGDRKETERWKESRNMCCCQSVF